MRRILSSVLISSLLPCLAAGVMAGCADGGAGDRAGAGSEPGPATPGGSGTSGLSARIAANERAIDASAATGLTVGFTSSSEKVFPDRPWGFSGRIDGGAELDMARNELESVQLVLFPHRDVAGVRVDVGPPARAGGDTGPAPEITVRAVGAVDLPEPRHPDGRAGWHPDPLLPNRPVDLEAGVPQPFLVTVRATPETAPGRYTTTIAIAAAGVEVAPRTLVVTVWDVALPPTPRFKSMHFGDWRLPSEMWPTALGYPAQTDETRLAHMLRLAELGYEMRLPPSAYLANGLDSWDRGPDGHTALGFPTHGTNAGDRTFNPARTDSILDFMLERGANHFFVAVTADVARLPDRAEQRRATLLAYLRDYAAHLRARGLTDLAYVYNIDEPWGDAVRRAQDTHRLIRDSVGADLVVMQNTNQNNPTIIADFLGHFEVLDINLGFYDVMAVDAYRRLHPGAFGELWWNVNLWPDSHPNLFLEFPLSDARIMGPMSYAFGIDGFEYWDLFYPNGLGSYHPIAPDELRIRWDVDRRSLDGTLVYPGADYEVYSSLRLESLRDGFEDIELLYLLEAVAPDHPLLHVPTVRGLNDYERDPVSLDAFRRDVAAAIMAARTRGE